jgi:hypothetical protein
LQLLLTFFVLGNCCQVIRVTMSAAYTKCNLIGIELNTGSDVLSSSSINPKIVNEGK